MSNYCFKAKLMGSLLYCVHLILIIKYGICGHFLMTMPKINKYMSYTWQNRGYWSWSLHFKIKVDDQYPSNSYSSASTCSYYIFCIMKVSLNHMLWTFSTCILTIFSSLFRVSWSIHTCFTATTATQWWRIATSPTTSPWPTSSLLFSTSPFVSFVSLHGESRNKHFQFQYW